MKAKILLPDSQQEVELQRGDILFWIRRKKCPQWFAALYLERGQQRLSDEQMQAEINTATTAQLQELLEFDDLLASHAIKAAGISLEDLSPTDYNVVLEYAKYGRVPKTGSEASNETEASDTDALEAFRAQP